MSLCETKTNCQTGDLEPSVRQEPSISTQRYSKKDLDHRSVISRLERTCFPPFLGPGLQPFPRGYWNFGR